MALSNAKKQELSQELRGERNGKATGRYHIYDKVKNKLLSNKEGVYVYANKAAAEKAIVALMAKPYNKGKEFTPFPQYR